MMRGIEIEDRQRLGARGMFVDQQFDALGMPAEDGEVEAVAAVIDAQRQWAPELMPNAIGTKKKPSPAAARHSPLNACTSTSPAL
jgi:hypothetical protein